VREIVDASGTIVTRYDYTSYQGPLPPTKAAGTNVEATFQTIGRYYHHAGSGLELALYRAYDPELGRWLSEDPLEDAELIEGANLYRYGSNRPIETIDVDGRFVWFVVVVVFGGAATAWAPGPSDDTSETPPFPGMPNPVDVISCGQLTKALVGGALRQAPKIVSQMRSNPRFYKAGYLRPPSRPFPIGGRYFFNTMKGAREAAERASPIGKAVKHCGPKAGGHRDHYHPAKYKPDGKTLEPANHDHYYY